MNLMTADRAALEALHQELLGKFEACKAKGLKLDMSRGKPSKAQLDLVSDILTVLKTGEDCVDEGLDARNYGELAGLPCARRYWADILDCRESQIFIGGAASLNMMFDVISRAYTHGLLWKRSAGIGFHIHHPFKKYFS